MRKRMILVLVLFLIPVTALAETVGVTAAGETICRYDAPNGQAIYYLASYPELEGSVLLTDVNFDGVEDVVLLVGLGASNVRQEFYVWDGAQYVLAQRNAAEDGLYNYRLLPETGLVVSDANNGMAGALREMNVFRWEGTRLCLVRSAVSGYADTTVWSGRQSTTTVDYETIRFVVRDAQGGILWEREAASEQLGQEAANVFAEWERALWEGLQ